MTTYVRRTLTIRETLTSPRYRAVFCESGIAKRVSVTLSATRETAANGDSDRPDYVYGITISSDREELELNLTLPITGDSGFFDGLEANAWQSAIRMALRAADEAVTGGDLDLPRQSRQVLDIVRNACANDLNVQENAIA